MSTRLQKPLEAANAKFMSPSKPDGGLEGAISCVEAIQDYFAERRPDWVRAGLLNPINQTVLTLRALRDGNASSSILKANADKIRNLPLNMEDYAVRGVSSALVDLLMKRRSDPLDVACGSIATKLRKRGFILGRGDTNQAEAITIKSWRKQAMSGDVPDLHRMYRHSKERFLALPGPVEAIVEQALDSLRGFMPPSP
jgi:hypothetical protein